MSIFPMATEENSFMIVLTVRDIMKGKRTMIGSIYSIVANWHPVCVPPTWCRKLSSGHDITQTNTLSIFFGLIRNLPCLDQW